MQQSSTPKLSDSGKEFAASAGAGVTAHLCSTPFERGFNQAFMLNVVQLKPTCNESFFQKIASCRSLFIWSAAAHGIEIPLERALSETTGPFLGALVAGCVHETLEQNGQRGIFIRQFVLNQRKIGFSISAPWMAGTISEAGMIYGYEKGETAYQKVVFSGIGGGISDSVSLPMRLKQRYDYCCQLKGVTATIPQLTTQLVHNPSAALRLALYRFAAGATRGAVFGCVMHHLESAFLLQNRKV